MTSREFCYWLQGWFELSHEGPTDVLTPGQVTQIKAHLALVFKHDIDPSAGPKTIQDALNHIHGPRPDGTLLRG